MGGLHFLPAPTAASSLRRTSYSPDKSAKPSRRQNPGWCIPYVLSCDCLTSLMRQALFTESRDEEHFFAPIDGSTQPHCPQRLLHTEGTGACQRSLSSTSFFSSPPLKSRCDTC